MRLLKLVRMLCWFQQNNNRQRSQSLPLLRDAINWKSKKFLTLQAKWYDRLRDEGFEDAEKGDNLRVYQSLRLCNETAYRPNSARSVLSRQSRIYQESVRDYYRLAAQFLLRHKFSSPVNRRVWELHSQGHSQATIAEMVPELSWKQSRYVAECLRDVMLGRIKGKRLEKVRKYT